MRNRATAQPPRAVIYVRVSSDAQTEGTSLDTQCDSCRACAARHGLAVLSEHEDAGKSAKTTVGRDALAAALAAATSIGAALIVHKFDRLSRNLGDGYDIRDLLIAKGCRIISATEGETETSPMSKAFYSMMMTFAELDNDMRTERCHAGMRARAMQGGWVSNPPIGYKLSRNPSGIPILIPDGDHSEILRQAFKDFASGRISKSVLIGRLKKAGHPDSTITRMIRQPAYGGIIRNDLTDGEDVTAAFPGLITADEYYIMESKLRTSKRASLKDNPSFPFTGTVTCAVCGQPLRSANSTSRGKSFGYYFCRTASHPKIRSEALHGQVNELFTKLGTVAPFLELLKEAISKNEVTDPEKTEADRHRRVIARLTPQLTRLRAALLDGTFTPEEYETERTRINASLAESRQWLASYATTTDRRSEHLDLMISVFSNPSELLNRLTIAQTKDLVRILFGELKLTRSKKVEPLQGSLFEILTTAQTDDLRMVGQAGVEPATPRLGI